MRPFAGSPPATHVKPQRGRRKRAESVSRPHSGDTPAKPDARSKREIELEFRLIQPLSHCDHPTDQHTLWDELEYERPKSMAVPIGCDRRLILRCNFDNRSVGGCRQNFEKTIHY